MDGLNFDLTEIPLRTVNNFLHKEAPGQGVKKVTIANPDGAHNIAVGLDFAVEIEVVGHAGYYAGGMNKLASITVTGSAGTGVAENMMSGRVHVKGFASNGAGASMHGGLLVIDGAAGDGHTRCLVHAAGVVAGMADDFDLDREVEPNRNVVGTVGIGNDDLLDALPRGFLVQEIIDGAQRDFRQVKVQAVHTYISSGAGSNTLAFLMSGRCASERNSEAIAT